MPRVFSRKTGLRVGVMAALVLSLAATWTPIAADNVQTDATRKTGHGRDVLIVGCDHHFPPFEFINAKGEPDGFNVDLIKAIAREMDLNIHFALGPWHDIRRDFEMGKIDLLAGMYKLESRQAFADFTTPHFVASYAIFVRDGSPIRSPKDLSGKKIIVQDGDLAHDLVKENNWGGEILPVKEFSETLSRLNAGEGDCAIVSKLQGLMLCRSEKLDRVKPVGAPLVRLKYAIAARKGDTELLATLNEGLNLIKEKNIYDALREKWLGIYDRHPGLTGKKILVRLGGAIALLLAALVLALTWTYSLRRQVSAIAKSLERGKAYLNSLIESMPSAIIGLDADNRVQTINRQAKTLLAARESLILGRKFADAFPALAGALPSGDGNASVFLSKKPIPVGNRRLIVNISRYRVMDGNQPGCVIRVDDITEKVRVEDMMAQTEKMLSLGCLAAGMAHELNNPLGVINQAAENLTRRLVGDLPKNRETAQTLGVNFDLVKAYVKTREGLDFLGHIRNAAARASNIIHDMLCFSSPGDTGKEPVSLFGLVEQALEIVALSVEDKENSVFNRVKIVRELDASLPPVPCVPSELQQVLINLFRNAVTAMTAKNYADGQEPTLILRAKPGKNMVHFEIEDNGVGVVETERSRVFEPFFTTRPAGKGRGLGLAIAYFIVTETHRGAMECVPALSGQGARFIIHLPLKGSDE